MKSLALALLFLLPCAVSAQGTRDRLFASELELDSLGSLDIDQLTRCERDRSLLIQAILRQRQRDRERIIVLESRPSFLDIISALHGRPRVRVLSTSRCF